MPLKYAQCLITYKAFGADTRSMLDPWVTFADPDSDPYAAAACRDRAADFMRTLTEGDDAPRLLEALGIRTAVVSVKAVVVTELDAAEGGPT